MCGVDIEHMRHLFCECKFAVECWQHSGLPVDFQDVEEAPSWLLESMSNGDRELLEKIGTVLWGIWFSRNKKVWEDKTISPGVTMNISTKMMVDWQEANKRKKMLSASSDHTPIVKQTQWSRPNEGWIKVNVDASVFSNDTSFALGLIMRNDHGQFMMGMNMRISGTIPVMEAEARGVLEALKWVEVQGVQNVLIECDSELVVFALQGRSSYLLEAGHIVEECREKLRQRADVLVGYVKKQANRAAHLLARVPCLPDSFNCFESPPSLLLEMLSSEFSI